MKTYGIFAASERLLMELGRNGANRQEMHELIREHSLRAWKEVQEGKENTLKEDLVNDKIILKYVSKEKAIELLNADEYVGDAPLRTEMIIEEASKIL
jgi:adenylosuccinate lyase